MKVGLFFGSFNPVHIGHLLIANYMISYTDLGELWFVISPQNPFKGKESLLNDELRLEMLKIAIGANSTIKVSDVEFGLSKPSFTIHTLTFLTDNYPEHSFVIIMGADGLSAFSKWKDHQYIEQHYERYVYPRTGFETIDPGICKNCRLQPAPVINISSTSIRQALYEKRDLRYYLPYGVYDFIKSKSLYSE
jgi:nicotinate-nucleotide adenylyltransferase